MIKETIFELKSLYRDNMKVYGYKFGSGEKTIAIVSGMRGDEQQQVYTSSKLIQQLKSLEEKGRIKEGKSILVIPAVNPYSLNIGKRFWATDNTDINRMFPGYDKGETTQRIAAGIFEALRGYKFGIELGTTYFTGDFAPSVQIMNTGWDYSASATDFGLPYVSIREPRPMDTTTLNYNWQVWETQAYFLFSRRNMGLDLASAEEIISSVLNFMDSNEIINFSGPSRYKSVIVKESDMLSIKSDSAGFFEPVVDVQKPVNSGQVLGRIIDTEQGNVLAKIISPIDGVVYFRHKISTANAHETLFKIIPS